MLQTPIVYKQLFRNICKGYSVNISYTGRLSIGHYRKTPKVAIFFFPGVQIHPKPLKTCFLLYLYYYISRKKNVLFTNLKIHELILKGHLVNVKLSNF